MKRVISFSLYGGEKRYTCGAVRNARLSQIYYPDWKCRFYVPEDYRETQILEDLGSMENVEIVTFHPGIPAMFQRFMAAEDIEVERFIVRDCDSRIGPEEAAAVAEWIAEDTILHTCRAHPAHARPINGGMWGLTPRRANWEMPSMTRLIDDFLSRTSRDPNGYSEDQTFLGTHIAGWAMASATQHDAVCPTAYPGSKPFPMKWPWPRFMGEVYLIDPETGEDVPRDDDWRTIPKDDE